MIQKCGTVALVGEPNCGKSTLLNSLINEKISIVTHKVQTTRTTIRGILCDDYTKAQIIFIDTPGLFFAKNKGASEEKSLMLRAGLHTACFADACLFMIDACSAKHGLSDQCRHFLEKIKKKRDDNSDEYAGPLHVALNKIDLISKPTLLKLANDISRTYNISSIFMISAYKKDGLEHLVKNLTHLLPDGPWQYDKDSITDRSMSFLTCEFVREKIYEYVHEEIPYSVSIEIESFTEQKNQNIIHQIIYVKNTAHKSVIIGKNGQKIKTIRLAAQKDIQNLLGKKTHLFLYVKIRKTHHS